MTLRDGFELISPSWLLGPTGFRLLYAFGVVLDAMHDKMEFGIKVRFPGVYGEESLPAIGDDRLIDRGPTEPAANYADRLSSAFDTWRGAGGPIVLLQNLAAFFQPSPLPIRLVNEWGYWHEIDPATGDVTRTRPQAAPVPEVDSISPTSGPNNATQAVTISGRYFFAGSTATVNGVALGSVVVASDGRSMTGVLPSGMTPGTGDVVVLSSAGFGPPLVAAYTVNNALSLTSLSVAQTDSAGGDTFLVANITGVPTGVEFSRDGGTTWVAGSLGTVTTFTAQIIPPAMAATASGLVRMTGSGGSHSNSVAIEFWAPTDDANCTLLVDAKSNPYNAATGVWVPRYSLVGGAGANFSNYLAAKHPSDGNGGVYFDGDATNEGGMVSGSVWTSYLGPLTGGAQHPGTAFSVHSSQTTIADTLANWQATPYAAATVFGNAAQGTIGIDNVVVTDDGNHYLFGHVYGNDGYKLVKTRMSTTGLHACVLRWSASAGLTGGVVQLSLDGALSGPGFDTASVTSAGSTNDAYLSSLTLGDRYSSGSATTQYFRGALQAFGVLKDIASDTFVTKFANWKLSRFGS